MAKSSRPSFCLNRAELIVHGQPVFPGGGDGSSVRFGAEHQIATENSHADKVAGILCNLGLRSTTMVADTS